MLTRSANRVNRFRKPLTKPLMALFSPLLLGAALAGIAAPAHAQQGRPLIGADIGFYIPTNSKARDAFGSTFTNYGFGFGRVGQPGQGTFYFDFSIIANGGIFQGGDRRAILIPLGVGYIRRFKPATSEDLGNRQGTVPYFGVSANIFANNLRSDEYEVNARWRAAYGGSAFVGVAFGDRFFTQARYYLLSSVEDLNLSGWNLSGGFRF
ncbi:MAG: hypothetical protein OHK0029_00440 [Armatimonadaceae bacterium]